MSYFIPFVSENDVNVKYDFKYYMFLKLDKLSSRTELENRFKDFVKKNITRSGQFKCQCLFGSDSIQVKSSCLVTDDKSFVWQLLAKTIFDASPEDYKNFDERKPFDLLRLVNEGVLYFQVLFDNDNSALIPLNTSMPLRFLHNQTNVESPISGFGIFMEASIGHMFYEYRKKAQKKFPAIENDSNDFIKLDPDFYSRE